MQSCTAGRDVTGSAPPFLQARRKALDALPKPMEAAEPAPEEAETKSMFGLLFGGKGKKPKPPPKGEAAAAPPVPPELALAPSRRSRQAAGDVLDTPRRHLLTLLRCTPGAPCASAPLPPSELGCRVHDVDGELKCAQMLLSRILPESLGHLEDQAGSVSEVLVPMAGLLEKAKDGGLLEWRQIIAPVRDEWEHWSQSGGSAQSKPLSFSLCACAPQRPRPAAVLSSSITSPRGSGMLSASDLPSTPFSPGPHAANLPNRST